MRGSSRCRFENCQDGTVQRQGCCFSKVGEESHTSKSMEKGSEIS